LLADAVHKALVKGQARRAISALLCITLQQSRFIPISLLRTQQYDCTCHWSKTALSSTKIPASRRLSILCTEEIDSLFGMPHFIEGERHIHFDLSPEERETIDAARTITAGVHLVLQLGYFKAKAQFFAVSLDHVRPDINHILTRYYPGRLMTEVGSLSKPTRLTQQRIILGLLGYRLCGGDEKQALIAFARRAARLSTQPKFISIYSVEHDV